MRIEPLGESAWILRDWGDRPAYAVAESLLQARLPGLDEAVPAIGSVGVYGDPEVLDLKLLAAAASELRPAAPHRIHVVPVCYALGDDFQEACQRLDLTPEEMIGLHSGTTFRCAAIGFCPGFPYLSGLPRALCALPRKDVPRVRVPAGSVALAAGQAGVYPMERPGGWWLIGRTPLVLVDVEEAYFPIEPGDAVRFEPIDEHGYGVKLGHRL